jgi:hypothetical protein
MGLRAVAKHNALLRLATVRHAMVGYIRRAPAGFGVCVAAHFFYKRAELGRQMVVWLAEAADMAAYEMELMRNSHRAREAYEAAAAADPAPPPPAPKGKGAGYHPSYDPYYLAAASTVPTDFPLSAKQYGAATKAAHTAYTSAHAPLAKWQADTAVSGHQPFAYGLGAIPPRPTGADAAVDAGVTGPELFARALAKWEAHVVPGAAPVAVSNAVAGASSSSSSSSSSSAAAAAGALAPAPGHPYFVAAMYARLGPRYAELAVPGGPLGTPKPGSTAAAQAAQQAAYYGGGGAATQKMADLALATAEAADQLLAELARMAPPKLSAGEGDDE